MLKSALLRPLLFATAVWTLFTLSACTNRNTDEETSMNTDNYTVESASGLRYTVYTPIDSKPSGLLVFFHGAGGNADSWSEFGGGIREYWEKTGIHPPVVVSISMGPVWFLTGKTSLASTNLADEVRYNILKPLETKYNLPLKHKLIGVSMGGFNALSLYLADPSYFETILLLSPALITLSPFAGEKEITNYVRRTGAYSFKQKIKALLTGKPVYTGNIETILNNLKTVAASDEDWDLINPLAPLESLKNPRGEFFIACAKKDIYGFQEGSERLFTLLTQKNAAATLVRASGTRHLLKMPEEGLSFTDFR